MPKDDYGFLQDVQRAGSSLAQKNISSFCRHLQNIAYRKAVEKDP